MKDLKKDDVCVVVQNTLAHFFKLGDIVVINGVNKHGHYIAEQSPEDVEIEAYEKLPDDTSIDVWYVDARDVKKIGEL